MYLVSRRETISKLFFIVSFTGLLMYVTVAFYSFHTTRTYNTVSQTEKHQESFNKLRNHDLFLDRFEKDLKYILVWSSYANKTAKVLPYEGQATFIESNCPEINCYITTNKTILNDDYTNFDAIVFNMSFLWQYGGYARLPYRRTSRQKYVFYGMQAADDHPICNIRVDNFFNWTWTYKFYSDIFSPYIEVKDLKGKVVAPKRNVFWINDLKPLMKNDIKEVKTKTKAIAWFIDECHIKINKMLFIPKLKRALREFNLTMDIYGCGHMKCPKDGCLKAIKKDYYFYLAYEGSVSDDYVTTEVLKGYHYDAVPIVVGGADYTKFLPENSYINYQFYTEEKLAAFLHHIIQNPSVYNDFFNWKKFYTINKAEEFRGYCDLCKLLNNKEKFQGFSTYEDFRTWWHYGSLREKCLPRGESKLSELKGYINEPARF